MLKRRVENLITDGSIFHHGVLAASRIEPCLLKWDREKELGICGGIDGLHPLVSLVETREAEPLPISPQPKYFDQARKPYRGIGT